MDGLRGAISRRASELLDDFRKAEGADLDAALPQLFRALVHVDAAGKAARRRASRDALWVAPAPVPRHFCRSIFAMVARSPAATAAANTATSVVKKPQV